MVFRVLLVDDEKTALDNLKYLIERHHPEFHIVGCAKNGQEALRCAEEQLPDLVLTDIRMPHMDGLELVECLKHQLPDIYSIIISGYAEFEYVRKAMIHGSIDYLLKPVDPRQMKDALDRATPYIRQKLYKKRIDILHMLSKGEVLNPEECARYFPEKAYVAAITRKNGLPSRALQIPSTELFSDEGAVIDLYGRDEMESLCIFPSGLMNRDEMVRFTQRPFIQIPGYDTTIVWKQDFSIAQAPTVIQKLYQTLNSRLVVGESQIIYLDDHAYNEEISDRGNELWHKDITQRITHHINNQDFAQAKKSVDSLLMHSQTFKVPQFLMENTVRNVLSEIATAKKSTISDYLLSVMIDDVFCNATTFHELSEGINALISELLKKQLDQLSSNKEMYGHICEYIEDHLSDPLNLQKICKKFGISQPTLSRLFREYADLSFNRFLVKRRMEKAILLLEDSNLLIRDVAERVGYSDQFYFSRIFRSIIGMSPSEYVTQRTGS